MTWTAADVTEEMLRKVDQAIESVHEGVPLQRRDVRDGRAAL